MKINKRSQVVSRDGWSYACDPLLNLALWRTKGDAQDGTHILQELRGDLGLNAPEYDRLWSYFTTHGISIPFNLIVVGTVNMDDTTHGFSRKVLDRAVVMDFLAFFPTEFNTFFGQTTQFQPLTYPIMSNAQFHQQKLEDIESRFTQTSCQFIQDINNILKRTPFELSYRALNELLLAVLSLHPQTENELHAVWDDFLMQKILPRIEGDQQKLTTIPEDYLPSEREDKQSVSSVNILDEIEKVLKEKYSIAYAQGTEQRKDFYRLTDRKIPWRSPQKIRAMRYRLTRSHFTSFWT